MNALMEMRGITKTFPGVKALDNVNLVVRPGEIHALVGENGAGKSTLMKVLSGVYPYGSYDGEIFFQDSPANSVIFRRASTSASSSSTRSLPWSPCCRSPRTSSSATSRAAMASSIGDRAFSRTRELLAMVGLDENPRR